MTSHSIHRLVHSSDDSCTHSPAYCQHPRQVAMKALFKTCSCYLVLWTRPSQIWPMRLRTHLRFLNASISQLILRCVCAKNSKESHKLRHESSAVINGKCLQCIKVAMPKFYQTKQHGKKVKHLIFMIFRPLPFATV